MDIVKKDTITSLELVDEINFFRSKERESDPNNRLLANLEHSSLLKIIKDEFEEEIREDELDCTSTYKDIQGKNRPMFIFTIPQAKQLLVRESKTVRRAVIKRLDSLEKNIMSEEFMLESLYPTAPQDLIKLSAFNVREVKRLVVEVKELKTEVIRKEDIIIGYIDNTSLSEKRAILNRVVRHNTKDFQGRYNALYRQFEDKYHINLNHRFNKYNEENKPKCKSKMAYICDVMGKVNELYEIAVKLYESDVNELVNEMYKLKNNNGVVTDVV